MRRASISLQQLGGAFFSELTPSLGVLTAYGVVLLPLSLSFFLYAVRRARLQGTLWFY
jgi:hypothetical protein